MTTAHRKFMRSLWSVLGPLGLGNPAWKVPMRQPAYFREVSKAVAKSYGPDFYRAAFEREVPFWAELKK